MSNGKTMPTIDSAPRDLYELKDLGPFAHRVLLSNLHDLGFTVWKNEAEKTTIVAGATPEMRASLLLDKLKEYDASRGVTHSPAPVVNTSSTVVVAEPQEVAPTVSKRTPRQVSQPVVEVVPQQAPFNGSQEILSAMARIEERLDNIERGIAGITKSVGINMSSLNDLKSATAASAKISQFKLGLLCLFGSQVLDGANVSDFTNPALEESLKALDALKALEGKD